MGLNRGSETAKALDSSSTFYPVSISRRQVKPSSFVSSSGGKHQTVTSVMLTSGPTGERSEVGADALSGHCLPGERLDFRLGKAFPSEIRKLQIMAALQDALKNDGLHAMKAESLLGLLSVSFLTVPLRCLYLRLF